MELPMAGLGTVGEALSRQGVSRRSLLKYGSYLATLMALPAGSGRAIAQALADARRQSVIWLSFQECTGCIESLTRSYSPSVEEMIFNLISLDYQETLQAAAGHAAEAAREAAMEANRGDYVVVVDGSVSTLDNGIYSTAAGRTNLDVLRETARDAKAVIAIGTCASFGGLPAAQPNPTGAVPVTEIITDKPIINVPGCPPMPEVMAGTIAYLVTFGTIPDLDHLNRPKPFFGDTIHDRCYRRPFYEQGKFAKSFDDEGAREGWCLYEVGCKGPTTYNSCATMKWNGGTSFPIQSGHGCLGCSEPNFWDAGSFYSALPTRVGVDDRVLPAALAGGAVLGAGAALAARARKKAALQQQAGAVTGVSATREGSEA